jgi:hypothetical protein
MLTRILLSLLIICLALPSNAAVMVDSYRYPAPSAGSPRPLGDTVSSTVFDLDATQNSSYGGTGQTWSNLETTPADSASQTDYDMFLGVDGSVGADDPVFTGTAGLTSAYWLVVATGGNDEFRNAATATTFMKRLHYQGTGEQSFTIAIAFRMVAGTNTRYLFSTRSSGSGNGVTIGYNGSEQIFLVQRLGGSSVTATVTGTISNGTDVTVIVSHDSVGNSTKVWINSLTEETLSHTFTNNVVDASGMQFLRATGDGNIEDGTRLYAVSGFNAFFTDTEADAVFDEYALRHGRTYAANDYGRPKTMFASLN